MMKEQQLDGLVCRLSQNVLMLSGYWPMNGLSLAVLPLEAEPVLIIPQQDERWALGSSIADVRSYQWGDTRHLDPLPPLLSQLRAVAADCGLSGKRLGIEADYAIAALPAWSAEIRQWTQGALQEIQVAFGDAAWTDVWNSLQQEASRKTEPEIENIRVANRLGGLALQVFRDSAVPGRAECEIAAAVEAAVQGQAPRRENVQLARAWASVMSGPNTSLAAQTYNISTSRVVEAGDLVSMELGLVADGYWTDLTRVHVAGGPTTQQQETFDLVARAHDAAVAAVRVGDSWSAVDAAAREVIAQSGQREYFPHITGHGVGFCYHEIHPLIGPNIEHAIEAGQIVAIEPGIYLPGWGGIRHEDNYLVTAAGAENLSPFPRGLNA